MIWSLLATNSQTNAHFRFIDACHAVDGGDHSRQAGGHCPAKILDVLGRGCARQAISAEIVAGGDGGRG